MNFECHFNVSSTWHEVLMKYNAKCGAGSAICCSIISASIFLKNIAITRKLRVYSDINVNVVERKKWELIGALVIFIFV